MAISVNYHLLCIIRLHIKLISMHHVSSGSCVIEGAQGTQKVLLLPHCVWQAHEHHNKKNNKNISKTELRLSTCCQTYPHMKHTQYVFLILVDGRKKVISTASLTSPLPLSPLLIPLSHRTECTYSTTPERREWEEKGYYDGEGRKERE